MATINSYVKLPEGKPLGMDFAGCLKYSNSFRKWLERSNQELFEPGFPTFGGRHVSFCFPFIQVWDTEFARLSSDPIYHVFEAPEYQ